MDGGLVKAVDVVPFLYTKSYEELLRLLVLRTLGGVSVPRRLCIGKCRKPVLFTLNI